MKTGELIGTRWKIMKILGSGMIGYTYLVTDTTSIAESSQQLLVAKVAIKETLDPKAIESVRNEAERLKNLHISRVPQFYDLEETEKELILLQTFLPGRPLREKLGIDKLWDEDNARAFLKDLLIILGQLHDAGIIHRDIKPENILYFENRAYLVDFNAATLMQVAESSNTTTIGTCQYMAPEYQIRGQSSRASDIFSVGCILAETLTGFSPPDMYSLGESRLMWRLFLPEEAIISDAFAEIIDQMVSPDPGTRFSTVAEVQAALEDPEYKRTELAIDTLIGVYQGEIQVFAKKSPSDSSDGEYYRLDEKITSVNCHKGSTTSLCWTFDGSSIISGSNDGTLAIVTPQGRVRHIRQNPKDISPVLSLTYGRETFVSTHADGTIRHWRIGNSTYELQKVLRLQHLNGPHLASYLGIYSENRVLIASDGLRPIIVELDYDEEKESHYTPWMIGCSIFDSPVFTHQGSRIVFTKAINNNSEILSVGERGSINIWDLSGRRKYCCEFSRIVRQCTCAELSPNGEILAIAGTWEEDDERIGVALFDITSPNQKWARISLNLHDDGPVTALSFDRTGTQLFLSTSASENAVQSIYKLPALTGKGKYTAMYQVAGQIFDIPTSRYIRISPDNRILASAHHTGEVRFLYEKNDSI